MSYFVIALGIFLSFGGALVSLFGYGIIQVERGWATFIAGSIAFSSGLVILTLGLILRKLAQVEASLRTGAVLRKTQIRGLAAYQETRESSAHDSVAPPRSGAASWPRNWAQRPMRSNLAAARNFLTSGKRVGARPRQENEFSAVDHAPIESQHPAGVEPETADGLGIELPKEIPVSKPEGRSHPTSTEAVEKESPKKSWPVETGGLGGKPAEKRPGIEQLLFSPLRGAEDQRPQSDYGLHRPPEAARIEAAIKESLFLPEREAASHEDGSAEIKPLPHPFEQTFLDLADHLIEQTEDSQPQPSLEKASPDESGEKPLPDESGEGELAIVGQFETAGTSYIRYSDGSVEARTGHAVFHFKSLDELRTFLENQGGNSA